MTRSRLIQVGPEGVPRLDHLIRDSLALSNADARRLILAGKVRVNRRTIYQPSASVRPKASIEVQMDAETRKAKSETFSFSSDLILFEDEHILIVNKPPGLPFQPTLDPKRASFYTSLCQYLEEREGGEIKLGVQHRLDRDTSGVMVLTRSPLAHRSLTEQFSERKVTKIYLALTLSPPSARAGQRWTIENQLGVVRKRGKTEIYGDVNSGQTARTDFKILKIDRGVALIEAKPHTGRKHQIRVHLSEKGFPILGDSLYAPPALAQKAPRTLLHAHELTFFHPGKREKVTFTAPIAEDMRRFLDR